MDGASPGSGASRWDARVSDSVPVFWNRAQCSCGGIQAIGLAGSSDRRYICRSEPGKIRTPGSMTSDLRGFPPFRQRAEEKQPARAEQLPLMTDHPDQAVGKSAQQKTPVPQGLVFLYGSVLGVEMGAFVLDDTLPVQSVGIAIGMAFAVHIDLVVKGFVLTVGFHCFHAGGQFHRKQC